MPQNPKNGDTSEQNPVALNPDLTSDPLAPKAPKLSQPEDTPTMTSDPESSVGTGLNPT